MGSWVSDRHPRAWSLRIRERLADGFRRSTVVPEGLIAHGRGEAFDYLIGERTCPFAMRSIRAASAALLTAESPVISVNGNVAALVPAEIVRLTEEVGARLEVNLFHRTDRRVRLIADWLRKHGAREILGTDRRFLTKIQEIHSERRNVDRRGILSADVVFVPLEDGDRTEALRRMGKTVIAVDLNPLSRTSLAANITIVDNIVRAVPLLTEEVRRLRGKSPAALAKILHSFDNTANLREAYKHISARLEKISRTLRFY
jgi:4-phosphopantoate--beta-alanine ligase